MTLNIPEDESPYRQRSYPIQIIRNDHRKGFGANHNAAFAISETEFFVVINPDIRLPDLRLAELRSAFDTPTAGACAPLVLNDAGALEDSARCFPTLGRLVRRVLGHRRPDYSFATQPQSVDWVAGMFVAFRRAAFAQVRGFDEHRFFMYYEDVDICFRLRVLGWQVVVQPSTSVVHLAQRASHRNLRHLRWHVTSAFRYLTGL